MNVENYTGVEIGSERDFDQAIRQMGFESTDQLATVTMRDGSIYTILSLGEQIIYGLEGSDLEGEVVTKNPEYILNHWEELSCCDAVSMSCWISIDCETPGVLDFRLSDNMVLGSMSEAVELLKGLDKSLEENECPYSFWTGSKKESYHCVKECGEVEYLGLFSAPFLAKKKAEEKGFKNFVLLDEKSSFNAVKSLTKRQKTRVNPEAKNHGEYEITEYDEYAFIKVEDLFVQIKYESDGVVVDVFPTDINSNEVRELGYVFFDEFKEVNEE